MSSNLAKRIIVAAIFGPAIIWMGYQGGYWLTGMVLLLGVLGLLEYLVREGFTPVTLAFWVALAAAVLLILIQTNISPGHFLPLTTEAGGIRAAMVIIVVFFMIACLLPVFGKRDAADLFRRTSRLVWGVLYIGLLYPFVWRVGQGFEGVSGGDSLLFLFGLLWLGDTTAMVIGKRFGKHQLAPSVSPRKTVEGLFGGLAGAVLVGLIIYAWKMHSLGPYNLIMLSLGCSLLGQIGDLVESMWKRSLGLKDSSAIIPGHGGVLDRFDSLLFAAPFMYGYLHLIQQ